MNIKKIEVLDSVFEINDIDLGNYFSKGNFNQWDIHYKRKDALRLRSTSNFDAKLHQHLTDLFQDINDQVHKLIKQSKIDWWPYDYVEKYDFGYKRGTISVYKDSSNFNMGLHIDNGLSFATSIINLQDNEGAHTVYYDNNTHEEIYRGPSKKGSGVIHINQPGLLHTGVNESDDERFFLMAYYSA